MILIKHCSCPSSNIFECGIKKNTSKNKIERALRWCTSREFLLGFSTITFIYLDIPPGDFFVGNTGLFKRKIYFRNVQRSTFYMIRTSNWNSIKISISSQNYWKILLPTLECFINSETQTWKFICTLLQKSNSFFLC